MIKKGITRQIVLHYFIVVFLALLLVEFIFMLAVQRYYYESIYNTINQRITMTNDFKEPLSLVNGAEDGNNLSYLLVNLQLDNTELQILDLNGRVLASSTAFESEHAVLQTSDISQAMNGNVGRWVGRQPITGEQVMAVSHKLDLGGENTYVVRYLTSLDLVNSKLLVMGLLAAAVGVAVLSLVLIISIGMANSIVRPINNITAVSAQMARGRLDVRVKGNYKHELGELASTLNFMAHEIVRSNQIKDDFISSISHELRTPLTSIKGWSETLDSGGYDPEETRIGMGIISKETERLIGLVEEMLDFSKLQQNQMKLVKGTVNIREIVQETMLNVWAKAEQKQVHLKLETDETRAYNVHGDGNRLKQVFLNVVDNAIKFSHENSWIFLSVKEENGQIIAAVQDTGIGISEEHLIKVRDRFFQVNHQNGGTGLGLAITQELVELHEGTITMQSELGSGTTVTVTLPAVAEEMGPEESVTASGDAEVTDERTASDASDTKSDLEKS
ncbi:Alkaline phosphatase synthesis sensor protein PhoR [Paenibacillus sp. GM1FR]|uniref:sensor histidine kinase n=1 Tax=Paenibacillus sp. GM1FR TaxID=2059267 RepID=UPI000C26F580|nr:HAMP domain-containing sensor histidine kinase [Paenibacillus sp. GM1FR]PJN62470.1 Alkaline phosphatase synthesis sensor protein PhoR [Paenibacillus sp. GM1FR]